MKYLFDCARNYIVESHKVHGALLQRSRYLPYLGGAPFTVVRLPSNIAMYSSILHMIYPFVVAMFHLPLQRPYPSIAMQLII